MKKSFTGKVAKILATSSVAFLMSCAGSAPSTEQSAPAVEPAANEAAQEQATPASAASVEQPAENATSSAETVSEPAPDSSETAVESSSSEVPAEAPATESSSSSESSEAVVPSESAAAGTVSAEAAPAVSPSEDQAAPAQEVAAAPAVPATPDTVRTQVSFFAIGDVLFHTSLYEECAKDSTKCNYDRVFKYWKQDIEAADFAAVNQETIFVPRKEGYTSYPTFGTPTQVGDAEIAAGFDIVTHATNHTIDRKDRNVDFTLEYWKSKGEASPMILGIHGTEEDQKVIRYQEKNGIKFAFLNNTYGLNGQKMPEKRQYLVDMQDSAGKWLKPIAEADANADVVVVFMHVGTEYVPIPSKDAQEKVAKAIDAGADIVVCAHPHVVEPYGVLTTKNGNTGLVYWSLGNFISNQTKTPTLLGGVAKFVVEKTAVGEEASFAVTSATFEGSVTHIDEEGHRAIPLKDYTPELAKAHNNKKAADLKAIQQLYKDAMEGYSKCGTAQASEKMSMPITRLNGKSAK